MEYRKNSYGKKVKGEFTVFKKILVPVDGSGCSFKALQKAAAIAEKFAGELTVMHVTVIPPVLISGFGTEMVVPHPVIANLEKEANEILRKARELLGSLPCNTVVKSGHPAGEILKEAQNSYDLIVIGSRGMGEIKGFLLGSVSDRVAHHAKCPVMIVH